MAVPRRGVFVVGTFFLSVLLYVDRICISAAKDPVSKDLGLSEKQMGWVLSAFALGYALCQTPAGLLADRFGPRRILSAVVVLWSVFTGLTAAAWNFVSIFFARLLFGAGEAGAFPGIARASFSWIPMGERGIVQGINFSGSRLGAAFALPLIATMVQEMGWRTTFLLLMGIGFLWAIFWFWWFRDDPTDHPHISQKELAYILAHRQRPSGPTDQPFTPGALVRSPNLWLISAQYFCSNFTFFFCLTWLFPLLKAKYQLTALAAGFYSAAPLVCGAFGNWIGGLLVDVIYRGGHWKWSRRIPAMAGFTMAALGLVGGVYATTPLQAILWFSLAIFGADMTLPPSWSFCIDIGEQHSGAVSGTMNMAGNIGSFLTALAFPYLAAWTGTTTPFFFLAAGLNGIAVGIWLIADPQKSIRWTR